MTHFVGVAVIAFLALAIVTVGLGALTALRTQRPEDIDDHT